MRNILIKNLEVEETAERCARTVTFNKNQPLWESEPIEEPVDWRMWVSGEEEINFGFPKSISQLFRDVFAKTMSQPLEDLQIENQRLKDSNESLRYHNNQKDGMIELAKIRLAEIAEAGLWQRIKFVFTKKI